MQTDHGADHSGNIDIIDEKSIQDKVLSALAVMVLVGLLVLGCYWQFLPLPAVQVEEESQKK
jgi:hypothetical protein